MIETATDLACKIVSLLVDGEDGPLMEFCIGESERSAAEAADCDAPAAHARLAEALHATAFVHPGVDRMRELVDEYVKVHNEVMLVWSTAQAVAERDLNTELELMLDEQELIREVLVAGARELASQRGPPGHPSDATGDATVAAAPLAHPCPICFENQSEVAFAPCSHTVCVKCSDKLAATSAVVANLSSSQHGGMKCPACRRAVTSHIKLFW